MKNYFKSHRVLGIVLGVLLSLLAVTAVGAAVITIYNMNQNVPSTVTVTAPPPTTTTVQSVLYTDLLCTQPFSGTLQFSSTDTSGTPFATLYVRTSEVPLASLVITSNLDPNFATFNYIFGTPTSANSYHGCPIVFTLTPKAVGTVSFNINVTTS